MEAKVLKQYVVDAFTDKVFGGNPAAVCVMDEWLPDAVMQKIAAENCLSETAFTVREGEGYRLRWFTPGCEVKLCGHATLATSFVLANFYEPEAEEFHFQSLSGPISVKRQGERFQLNFPASKFEPVEITQELVEAVGFTPKEAYLAASYLLVMECEEDVQNYQPDFSKLIQIPKGGGVLITAPSSHEGYDFASRCFFPKQSINEDPVTGSSHCTFVPYWSKRLGKKVLTARQLSRRQGTLYCEDCGERILISGSAVLYSKAEITVPVDAI